MTIDYEAEYNNRRRVPENPEIVARWLDASARARATLTCELDIAYGAGERHRYDLFQPDNAASDVPVVAYIHGGYWQRGDRKDYSFIANVLVARGARVAIPSYSLCPQATVADIIAEMRTFLTVLWARTNRRAVVAGHSAGGHLAAAMLATDWTGRDGVPNDLVRAAYAISGVFELEPLIPTSLNEALRLSPQTARDASPLLWPAPRPCHTLVAAVGGAENSEFLRQSGDIATAWSAAGVNAERVVVPGANHFTVVDEIARTDSAMVNRILELARA